MKRHTYFWISFSVGKWTQQTCREMIEQMFSRLELPLPNDRIEIYTDGNDDYSYVLPDYYADTCIDYGQMVKVRKSGRVVDKIKRTIFGHPYPNDIETTNVENFNGILRERNGRLVRKTKCFSKLKWKARCSLLIMQFYWNFINKFRRELTPGMLEGVVEKPWTWEDFLMFHKAV